MTSSSDLEASLREHGRGLHQLACALLGRAEADDAMQEVWLEALRASPPRQGPLGGWLRTVLQHVAWRTRRGQRRRRAREAAVVQARDAWIPDHAEVVARQEHLHDLVRAVHRLEPACREVIWQRFFEGLPPRAIATASGEPVATVKSRLARGLAQLRERLDARAAGDWRHALGAAFGLGKATTTTAAWPGVWLMAAGAKLAAAVSVAIAFGLWWWLDGSPEASAMPPPGSAFEQVAATPAPNDVVERIAVDDLPMPLASTPDVTVAASAGPVIAGVANVRGRLIDAVTGEPLVGVMVSWNNVSQLRAQPDDPGAATDADGRFEFEVPAELGSMTIIASTRGYVGRWAMVGGLRAAQVDDLGTAPLRPGCTLSVRIVDADSGRGVGGAVLELRFDRQPVSRWLEALATARSASDGSCEFGTSLPFAPCTLAIKGGDHELVGPAAIEVTPMSPRELTVTVRRRPTIRGVVVDVSGAPIAGVGLSTQGLLAPEVTTASDGTFVLVCRRPDQPPAVTVSLPDTGTYQPHDPLPNVAWGTNGLYIELRPCRPFAIEVVDDGGAPVEHFAVTLDRPGTFSTRHLLRHRGVHAQGRLEVDAVAPGVTSLRVVPLDIEWAPSEAVPLGNEVPVRVVVTRRAPCRVLVVRGGAPVANALVEYVHERQPLQVQHRASLNDPRDRAAPVQPLWPELVAAARTGSDGVASLWRDNTQVARALRVHVGDEPHVLVRAPVFAADGTPLRIELPQWGHVRGRVLLQGRSHDEVTMRLRAGVHEPHVNLQPDGTFMSPALPVGPCRIELLVRSGMTLVPVDGLVRDMTIEPGNVGEVVMDLGALAAARVRGRVTADAPLPAGLAIDFVRVTPAWASIHASATVGDGGRFAVEGLLPGTYLAAFRLPVATSAFVPALQLQPIVVVGGEEIEHHLRFVRRRLTVHFVRPDGSPARGHRTVARCGGGRWPAKSLFAPVLDETLVIDPAPALPIEFGVGGSAPWSEPVRMPDDRNEAEVTVVVRAE